MHVGMVPRVLFFVLVYRVYIYRTAGNATITKTEGYVVWNYFHQKQPRASQIATSISLLHIQNRSTHHFYEDPIIAVTH